MSVFFRDTPGQSREYLVYLFYQPDLDYLKNTALTLKRAQSLGPYENKRRLVFAATKYLDQDHLDTLRIFRDSGGFGEFFPCEDAVQANLDLGA